MHVISQLTFILPHFSPESLCFCAAGNTFYLVMPTEYGESATDDPPTPTASNFPQTPEEALLAQTQTEEDTPTGGPDNAEDTQPERAEETSQSHAAHQSHVIKNVDEIFLTIEGLMSKLRQLKVSLCSGSDMDVNPLNLPLQLPQLRPLLIMVILLCNLLPKALFTQRVCNISSSSKVVVVHSKRSE